MPKLPPNRRTIQQPLAIAIIAGLLQYPLVLVAMPVLVGLTLGRDGHEVESSGYGEAAAT